MQAPKHEGIAALGLDWVYLRDAHRAVNGTGFRFVFIPEFSIP